MTNKRRNDQCQLRVVGTKLIVNKLCIPYALITNALTFRYAKKRFFFFFCNEITVNTKWSSSLLKQAIQFMIVFFLFSIQKGNKKSVSTLLESSSALLDFHSPLIKIQIYQNHKRVVLRVSQKI